MNFFACSKVIVDFNPKETWWLCIAASSLIFTIFVTSYIGSLLDDRYHLDQGRLASEYIHNHGSEIEVVFLGSSHIFTGIDPSQLAPVSMNISLPACNVTVATALFNFHQKYMKTLSLVVVEISPSTLFYDTVNFKSSDIHSITRNWGISLTKLGISRWKAWKAFLASYIPSCGGSIIDRWSAAIQNVPKETRVTAGFAGLDRVLNNPEDARADAFHHYRLGKYDPVKAITDLRVLAKSLKEQDIFFIVLLPPHHPMYWEAQHESHRDVLANTLLFLEQFLNEDQIWDFRSHPNFTVEHFADGHHLNIRGAEILSSEVNDRISVIIRKH